MIQGYWWILKARVSKYYLLLDCTSNSRVIWSSWRLFTGWLDMIMVLTFYRYPRWSTCQGDDGRVNSEKGQVAFMEEAATFPSAGGWPNHLVQVQMGRERPLYMWVLQHAYMPHCTHVEAVCLCLIGNRIPGKLLSCSAWTSKGHGQGGQFETEVAELC